MSKIRLIFRSAFIAPVIGSKMEFTHKTIIVDMPKGVRPMELVGGEWLEEYKCHDCGELFILGVSGEVTNNGDFCAKCL